MTASFVRVAYVAATLAVTIALATSAVAKPHKVLILPIDGTADAATRTKLTATVQKLARLLDGQVMTGNTTFAETSSAVGCDPSHPKCVDDVLAALSVDEIVWGTATTQRGQTTLVVKRASSGAHPRELTATISTQDNGDKTTAMLLPVFQAESEPVGSAVAPIGSGSAGDTGSAVFVGPNNGSDVAVRDGPPVDVHDRNMGIGLAVGGGLALVLGLALWSSEGSLQDRINQHSTNSAADIADLKDLEDRANKYAWGGNVMVVLGLAAGGYGAYYLWKHHKAQATITASPVRPDQGTGATISIGGTW